MCLIRFQLVHRYHTTVTDITWKKYRFILSKWSKLKFSNSWNISLRLLFRYVHITLHRWNIPTEVGELLNRFQRFASLSEDGFFLFKTHFVCVHVIWCLYNLPKATQLRFGLIMFICDKHSQHLLQFLRDMVCFLSFLCKIFSLYRSIQHY